MSREMDARVLSGLPVLRVWGAALVALLSIGSAASADAPAPEEADEAAPKKRMGWAEKAVLEPWGFRVRARLDTGANTASIHAESIERFELEGRPWVGFDLEVDPSEGVIEADQSHDVRVELPVLREVLIKRKDGPPDRRPVVPLVFCLDGDLYREEFSLKDREGFDYPLLLGRRFLAERALVDPDRRFLTEPGCSTLSETTQEEGSDEGNEGPDG